MFVNVGLVFMSISWLFVMLCVSSVCVNMLVFVLSLIMDVLLCGICVVISVVSVGLDGVRVLIWCGWCNYVCRNSIYLGICMVGFWWIDWLMMGVVRWLFVW